MSILNTILRLILQRDELLGQWETTNEGGFQIMMGSVIVFEKGGNGYTTSWGDGDEEPNGFTEKFVWKRIGKKRIQIKKINDSYYKTIEYKIENYKGAYNEKYYKLFEPSYKMGQTNLKGFWEIPNELFKEK